MINKTPGGEPNVPIAKLQALLKTSNRLLESIFDNDGQKTLELVVQEVHRLLDAEAQRKTFKRLW